MYNDVNVNDIGETATIKRKNDPTADVKHFFFRPIHSRGSEEETVTLQCLQVRFKFKRQLKYSELEKILARKTGL